MVFWRGAAWPSQHEFRGKRSDSLIDICPLLSSQVSGGLIFVILFWLAKVAGPWLAVTYRLILSVRGIVSDRLCNHCLYCRELIP